MRNPIHSLRNFVRLQGRKARDFAEKTREVTGLRENDADHRSGQTADAEPGDSDGEFVEARRTAAKADGGDEEGASLGQVISALNGGQGRPAQPIHTVFRTDGRHRHRDYLIFSATGDEKEASDAEPDVVLDVSDLEVDELDLDVEELKARVALHADVADLLNVDVGAEVELGEVDLTVQGVGAEALLKVRLDEVRHILTHALETLGERPELISGATNSDGQVGDTGEGDDGEEASSDVEHDD